MWSCSFSSTVLVGLGFVLNAFGADLKKRRGGGEEQVEVDVVNIGHVDMDEDDGTLHGFGGGTRKSGKKTTRSKKTREGKIKMPKQQETKVVEEVMANAGSSASCNAGHVDMTLAGSSNFAARDDTPPMQEEICIVEV